MNNIENTEAIVEKGILGRLSCKISLLAGNIGDSFVKLYHTNHPDYDKNILNCPYMGLAFETDKRVFSIWVSSTNKSFPLYKGDTLRIKFEDTKILNLLFSVGGHPGQTHEI